MNTRNWLLGIIAGCLLTGLGIVGWEIYAAKRWESEIKSRSKQQYLEMSAAYKVVWDRYMAGEGPLPDDWQIPQTPGYYEEQLREKPNPYSLFP